MAEKYPIYKECPNCKVDMEQTSGFIDEMTQKSHGTSWECPNCSYSEIIYPEGIQVVNHGIS